MMVRLAVHTRLTAVTVTGLLGLALATTGAAAATAPAAAAPLSSPPARSAAQTATPIGHFIFLMQGGRTFDNYFGSYPGATGLAPGTCQPTALGDPGASCVKPFLLDSAQRAPLSPSRTIIENQWDGGKMDGFVSAYQRQDRAGAMAMGYYDATTLPFYWKAASEYVLFDHFFSATRYGIRNNRSYWVSARPAPGGAGQIPTGGYGNQLTIFDRLQAAHVSWKFYVQDYNRSQTYQSASPVNPETQTARVPLVDFRRFTDDPNFASHIVGLDQYYRDLAAGTLPAVAYVASSSGDDERSAQSVQSGQSLVQTLITQLMQSRYWDSSALMWSYDGSGGWFDGVRPPQADGDSLGFRVPALLVSAYARKGQVNHTVLDYTSALKFIEQNWRLAPLTTRDAKANSLGGAFDFAAGPRTAILLRAGQAATLDPFPVARSLSPHQVTAVYVLYGSAAAVAVLLTAFAAWSSRRGRRGDAGEAAVDGLAGGTIAAAGAAEDAARTGDEVRR